jgi:succinate-semialdehyde dehydrogenase/glutarate-semialdehyde dehydrogenase
MASLSMTTKAEVAMPIQFHQLYVNGEWRDAADGATLEVYNPATGDLLARVASAGIEDGFAALDAAECAFEDWASRTPRDRGEILRRAFQLLIASQEEFARLITLENGKALPDARAEVAYAAEFFRWNAEEAVRVIGEISRAPSNGTQSGIGAGGSPPWDHGIPGDPVCITRMVTTPREQVDDEA